MDTSSPPAFTLAAQPGAAAHAATLAPALAAETVEAADEGADAEAAPCPASRKERLLRLLLACRQLQQR